jgi:hypothetical protein
MQLLVEHTSGSRMFMTLVGEQAREVFPIFILLMGALFSPVFLHWNFQSILDSTTIINRHRLCHLYGCCCDLLHCGSSLSVVIEKKKNMELLP